VTTWYQTYLDRKPGNNEEQVWVTDLLSGQSEAAVLSSILGSDEFFNRTGGLGNNGQPSNTTFVEGVYEVLLNRTASTNEAAFWANLIPTSSRTTVALE